MLAMLLKRLFSRRRELPPVRWSHEMPWTDDGMARRVMGRGDKW